METKILIKEINSLQLNTLNSLLLHLIETTSNIKMLCSISFYNCNSCNNLNASIKSSIMKINPFETKLEKAILNAFYCTNYNSSIDIKDFKPSKTLILFTNKSIIKKLPKKLNILKFSYKIKSLISQSQLICFNKNIFTYPPSTPNYNKWSFSSYIRN